MGEYDRWQGRYAAPEYIFGEGPNAFLGAQRHLLPASGKALAVADGEGRNGVWLAEQGLDVLSIDFAPNGQAKAKALAEKRGVKLELSSPMSTNGPTPKPPSAASSGRPPASAWAGTTSSSSPGSPRASTSPSVRRARAGPSATPAAPPP